MSNCNGAFNEIEEIENMENITYAVLSIENNVFGLVRAGLGDSNDISESSLFSDAVLYVFKREQANLGFNNISFKIDEITPSSFKLSSIDGQLNIQVDYKELCVFSANE